MIKLMSTSFKRKLSCVPSTFSSTLNVRNLTNSMLFVRPYILSRIKVSKIFPNPLSSKRHHARDINFIQKKNFLKK